MPREIKRDVRRRRRTSAWLSIEGRAGKHECQLVDVSDSGAKILIDAVTELPESFRLTRVPRSSYTEACNVIWRKGRTIGIKFVR